MEKVNALRNVYTMLFSSHTNLSVNMETSILGYEVVYLLS